VDERAGDVVLIGMMGTGKTTVGRLVADRLGRAFVDTDREVEARTGRTVAAIFAEEGEAVFRRWESLVLREVLARRGPRVVAVAGGAVGDAANRALLAGAGVTVWLRADPTVLVERVRSGTHRPLLADDPAGALRRLADERAPWYAEVADVVVDVDALHPDAVADAVVAACGGASCSG
jgi:shikimate kinase